MYFQVSTKDFQNAVKRMASNHATVICCRNPRMSATIKFNVDDNGEIYSESSYNVGTGSVNLGRNVQLNVLVNKFNEAMREYIDNENEVITIDSMLA